MAVSPLPMLFVVTLVLDPDTRAVEQP